MRPAQLGATWGEPPPQDGQSEEHYFRSLLRREQEMRRQAEERLQEVLAEALCERAERLEEEMRAQKELLALQAQAKLKDRFHSFERATWKFQMEEELVAQQNDKDRMRRQVRGHRLSQRSLMKEVGTLLPRLRGLEEQQFREQPTWGGSPPAHRQSEKSFQLLKSLADRESSPEPVPYVASPLKLSPSDGLGCSGAQVHCLFTGAELSSGSSQPQARSPRGSSSAPDLFDRFGCTARGRSTSPGARSSRRTRAGLRRRITRAHSGPPLVVDRDNPFDLWLATEAFPPPVPMPLRATEEDCTQDDGEEDAPNSAAAEEELRAYVRHMQAYARLIQVPL